MLTRLIPVLLDATRLFRALVRIRVLGKPTALFAGWNITFRCNLKCSYCGAFEARGPELDTKQILLGLDVLWDRGVRWLTFGGGEPMVRDDIGIILRCAHERGFKTFLSTNGSFIPENPHLLRWVDHVNLSLDGGRDVHDAVRGKGSFDRTLQAVDVCRQAGVGVSFQNTLSLHNLDAVEDTLRIAKECRCSVMFHPATQWLDSSTKPNPIAPPVDAYRRAVENVIALKRQGFPVRNSVAGLRHLAKWPEPTPIWCGAGLVTFEIEPDGAIVACHQAQVGDFLKGKRSGNIQESPFHIVQPNGCLQCWCGPLVELAMLFTLRWEPIVNAIRMI